MFFSWIASKAAGVLSSPSSFAGNHAVRLRSWAALSSGGYSSGLIICMSLIRIQTGPLRANLTEIDPDNLPTRTRAHEAFQLVGSHRNSGPWDLNPPSPEWKVRQVRDRAARWLRLGWLLPSGRGYRRGHPSFGRPEGRRLVQLRDPAGLPRRPWHGARVDLYQTGQQAAVRSQRVGRNRGRSRPTGPQTTSTSAAGRSSATIQRSSRLSWGRSVPPCSTSRNRALGPQPTSPSRSGAASFRCWARSSASACGAIVRGWFSFVPTDDYFYWCDFYGCGVSQGSVTLSQGEVTGGLVIKFSTAR